MFKLYEICFDDGWGICIKANKEPTEEQALNHLSEEERGNYTIDCISALNEITEDEAKAFYDVSNIDNWKVLIID
jgi:hypothetical protein